MRTIFYLLMITSFAFAEDDYEEIFLSTPEEIASAHAAKDTLIGGLVSPLSGQLVLQETDLIAKGAQDVVLTRRYLPPYMPCQLVEKPIWEDYAFANYLQQHYRGWVIFAHLRLQMDEHGVVRVTEPSGATLDFATSEERAMLVSPAFGMSNVSNETPSGKFDLFNTRIKVLNEKKTVLVFASDGTVRHYARVYQKSGRGEYLLQKEQLPNGKILRYCYKGRYLHNIESLDPQERFVYASITITPEGKQQRFTTQAEEWATYSYERKTLAIDVKDRHKKIVKQQWLPPTLQDVSSPFCRHEHLEYCPRFLLGEQRGKDRIFRSFHKGYGATKSPLSYRVHQLEFPLREDHDFEVAYEMDYDVPIPGKRGGITMAKQKDGSFIRYHISQDLLLSRIQFFDEKRTLKKEKIYTWGHPNGFFAQKQRNWLFAVETKDGEGKLLVKKSFEYDLFGNPIEETLTGDFTGNQELETFTITRKFSKDGRHLLLQEEVEDGGKVLYEYLPGTNLPVSKMTLDQENETVASVNALNQLEALGEIECVYNLNGDLIEKRGSKHIFYDFNPLHQLTSATQDSKRVEFSHDPLGRILKRTLFTLTPEGWKETDTDLYLHDGKEEISAFCPDGTAKNLRIIGLNKEPIAIELEGRPFACITDLHRNVEQLIDPTTSTVANSYRHSAFGEELFVDETIFNPWRYQGKRYDPDLQLINFGKRFYDPQLIRWLTHDPAGFIDSYNLYQFIFNSPFRYYDPDGTHAAALSIPIWGAGTAAYIAAVGGPAGWVIGGVIAAILIWKAPGIFETINRQSSAHRVNSEVQGNVTAASDKESSYKPEDSLKDVELSNTNPFEGPVDEAVVVVDEAGNAINVPEGNWLTGTSDGKWVQVRDKDGAPTGERKDGGGHAREKDIRGREPHGHVPGVSNVDGTPWLPIK